MPLQFVKSQKGHDLLVHSGFTFRKEKDQPDKTIWKCIEYRTHKCPGRAHTSEGRILKSTIHNHVPDAAEPQTKQVISNIKERAKNTQESSHQIIADSTVGLSSSVSAKLPSVPAMKKRMQRARQQQSIPLANPNSLSELQFPEEYTQTCSGSPFLLFDSGPSNNRILLFSTQRNLELMDHCDHWYADGTFKAAPPLFTQIYTIHAVKYNSTIPTVFALMPNKSQDTYVRLFNAIKDLKPNLNPISIMTDFEQSAINAFHQVFPNASQRGCFFHLSQCLWRRIQRTEGFADIPRILNSL